MTDIVDVAIPVITFLALMAVGLDLTPGDFQEVRRRPRVIVTGLVAPVVLLPAIALGLLALFQPPPHVAAGLLLIAACPIGGVSNTFSFLARASTALSVLLTTLSIAAAGLTMPLISALLGFAMGQALPLAVPRGLAPILLLMVVLPVVSGMWMRRRWPQVAADHRSAIQRAAFVALGLLLVLIVGNDPARFVSGLTTTVPLAAAFVVSSMAAGWLVAMTLGASSSDRFTLAMEFATRNVTVATAMAVTILRDPSFALFGATYFLAELPLGLAAVAAYRWTSRTPALRSRLDPSV